jgi:hypothetical protein
MIEYNICATAWAIRELNSIPGRGSDYSLLHGGVQTGYGAQVTQK